MSIPQIDIVPYTPFEGSKNPIFEEIKNGNESKAWSLIQEPHDLSIISEEGYSILTCSIESQRSIEFLEKLFTHEQIPINARDGRGFTPLYLAASRTHSKANLVALLLIHGAIDSIDVPCGDELPAQAAARAGNIAELSTLLETESYNKNALRTKANCIKC